MATDNVTTFAPAAPVQADPAVFKALLTLADKHRTELFEVMGSLSCVLAVVDGLESMEIDEPQPSFAIQHALKTLDRIAAELEGDPLIQRARGAVEERDQEGQP